MASVLAVHGLSKRRVQDARPAGVTSGVIGRGRQRLWLQRVWEERGDGWMEQRDAATAAAAAADNWLVRTRCRLLA